MKLEERINIIENGRFKNISELCTIKNICIVCKSFNYKSSESYLCSTTPNCIGTTLSDNLKSYLLMKLFKITEDEHLNNCNINQIKL